MTRARRSLVLAALAGCGDNLGAHDPAEGRIVVELGEPGAQLAVRFLGASYETSVLAPDAAGAHYFTADNTALARTVAVLGLRSLRFGGNEADLGPLPAETDLQPMLDFVAAADLELIYTLRLRTFDPTAAATVAHYLLDHSTLLACLSIGNEADWYLASYADYATQVRAYEDAIADPRAHYCTPDSGNTMWVGDSATDGNVVSANAHAYFGGNGQGIDAPGGRDWMLSSQLVDAYAEFLAGVAPAGDAVPLRLAETNSYANGGCPGASDAFASALWGLDYLWWWASHRAIAVHFHTGDHVSGATTTYSLFKTASGGYHIHPLGYAVKAFDFAGHGELVPVTLSDGRDLTAYATRAADGTLAVTIINKSHDANARTATLSIMTPAVAARAWRLEQLAGDVAALDGVQLGGAEITDDGTWAGAAVEIPIHNGRVELDVAAASAVIVQIMR